jgi:molecular chaperone GrpE
MATPDEQNTPTPDQPLHDGAELFVDELTVDEKLAAAQNEIAALKDQHLRAVAEQENIRKRNVQEVQSARDYAARDFAFALLSAKDTLEMVLKDEQSTPEQLKMGVDMTLKNMVTAFDRAKVKEVKAEKAKFDPNLHQAMTQIESTETPGTVLQVFQKGYTIGDRVLRPAMVAVAKARESDRGDVGDTGDVGGHSSA